MSKVHHWIIFFRHPLKKPPIDLHNIPLVNHNFLLRNVNLLGSRFLSSAGGVSHQKAGEKKAKALTRSSGDSGGAVTLSMGEKVKENTKTVGYGSVVLIGLAVTAGMLYTIFAELLSGESINNIYTRSFKLCKNHPEVQDALGTPIKCYGEETRRGWRRHVAHQEFIQNNQKILRMKFYVEGAFRKGTVHVEKKAPSENGKYEYQYLIVDVDGYPPRRINVDVKDF